MDCSDIKKLDLSNRMDLTKLDESIVKYENLLMIDLSNTPLPEFPKVLFQLKTLKFIDIRGTLIQELPHDLLIHLPNLNQIEITETKINQVPTALHRCVWELPYNAKWI